MEKDTAQQLLHALRDCALYPSEAVAAAEGVLGAGGDDVVLADRLQSLNLLTSYQYRKVRTGRAWELLFGPYLILEKIGEGGMGKVYRAVQFRLGRVVALKIVRQQLMANKIVLQRYKREAKAAFALDHPNIVRVFDADEVAGRYYIAMEYVDGIDLSRMVKEFGNPPTSGLASYQESCEYARQAALGLQHAHDRRLVHRDIKPSNLLVYGDRALPGTKGKATVKILDMGLVRSLIDADDVSRTELTRDGTVVGTPDYMAPEQAKNSSTVDSRADLYALGCTLFFLIRGQPPFADGTPIEKLLKHQSDPPPDIRQGRPDVPEELAAVVHKLLEKNPEDRYQTAVEVAMDLAPFCPDGPALVAESLSTRLPAPVVHEPFSFTDDPNAIHSGPIANPAPVVAATAAETPGPVVGPTPVTPSVRLRVVKRVPGVEPPAVQAAEAVAIPPATTSGSRPDNPPSSGSLRAPDNRRVPRPKAEPPAPRKDPSGERRKLRKAPPQRRISPALLIGLVAAGLVVVTVAGVLIARGNRKNSQSTPSSPDQVPAAPGQPPGVGQLPVRAFLPDGATAVLIAHPKPYWDRVRSDPGADLKTNGQLDALARRSGFDPRQYDRGVVAWTGQGNYVAVGEGAVVTPEWLDGLSRMRGVRVEETTNGKKVYTLSPWGLGPRFAAPVGARTYAIGSDKAAVARLAAGNPPKAVATELEPVLAAAESADRPMVTFAAGPDWALPDGPTLASQGIQRAAAVVRLDGNDLAAELVLVGRTTARVTGFRRDFLANQVARRFPALRPLVRAVEATEPSVRDTGSGVEVTFKCRVGVKEFRDALEQLLPPVSPPPTN